jgi:acetyltransferase-like isoleucine patch superfamily enzyme
MRTILFGLVFISPPFLKTLLLRWFAGAKIAPGARIGWLAAVSARNIELGPEAVVRPLTIIRLGGDFKLGEQSEISSFNLIYGSAGLLAGDRCYIGPQSLINADEDVRMGHNSALGPRSMVFTHGSFLPYNEGYWSRMAGVTLGNYVWCAAGVFLHPGVEIGDDSFVNSRSVVTQSIPPGSVVEGNPAKVIYPMERVKRKMTPKRLDATYDQILQEFNRVVLSRELGITQVASQPGELQFVHKSRKYVVKLVRSTDNETRQSVVGAQAVYLINCAGWKPQNENEVGALAFDLLTMQTAQSSDPIHEALRTFMLRFYGIRFKLTELTS